MNLAQLNKNTDVTDSVIGPRKSIMIKKTFIWDPGQIYN